MKSIIFNFLIVFVFFFAIHNKTHAQKGFLKNPVIAHRGAWKEFNLPENSLASLKKAIEIGCAGSEFDVHLTTDDSIVIIHDDKYEGMVIEKSTYAQLAAKPLANGEPLPTLHQYLETAMQQHHTRLILEIKKSVLSNERTIELTSKVIETVQQHHSQKWIVYISFDYGACKKIRELDNRANIQFLNFTDSSYTPAKLKTDKINGLDYYYQIFEKYPEWVDEAKKLKLDLNAWTVDNTEDLKFFLDKSFNYITTNHPSLLLGMIKK